jgi:hypothetical protein
MTKSEKGELNRAAPETLVSSTEAAAPALASTTDVPGGNVNTGARLPQEAPGVGLPKANPVLVGAAGVPEAPAPGVDLGDDIKQTLIDAIEDLTGTAREAVANYINDLAPLMAQQAALMASDNPDERAKATKNMRDLQNQALLRVGRYGIALQQRQEQRLIAMLNVGIAFAKRAVLA